MRTSPKRPVNGTVIQTPRLPVGEPDCQLQRAYLNRSAYAILFRQDPHEFVSWMNQIAQIQRRSAGRVSARQALRSQVREGERRVSEAGECGRRDDELRAVDVGRRVAILGMAVSAAPWPNWLWTAGYRHSPGTR